MIIKKHTTDACSTPVSELLVKAMDGVVTMPKDAKDLESEAKLIREKREAEMLKNFKWNDSEDEAPDAKPMLVLSATIDAETEKIYTAAVEGMEKKHFEAAGVWSGMCMNFPIAAGVSSVIDGKSDQQFTLVSRNENFDLLKAATESSHAKFKDRINAKLDEVFPAGEGMSHYIANSATLQEDGSLTIGDEDNSQRVILEIQLGMTAG